MCFHGVIGQTLSDGWQATNLKQAHFSVLRQSLLVILESSSKVPTSETNTPLPMRRWEPLL